VRLIAALAELAACGAIADGIDRALFTPPEHAARLLFARWARACGASLAQDRAGNLFARRAGTATQLPPIQCGSHLDTVKGGGPYDGAYGVVAGLAVLASLAERDIATEHPFEVVAWAGEEGSRFPVGTLGSAFYAGLMSQAEVDALCDEDLTTFAQAFAAPNGALADVPIRETREAPAAYLELHIEQGPVLERAGARLGIVTAIAGQRRYTVTVDGVQGHAGTVPMRDRVDALAASAEIVLAVERAALAVGECVATVGKLDVVPNQANVVPGHVVFRLDVRSADEDRIERVVDDVTAACAAIAARRGVSVDLRETERRAAVAMDPRIVELVTGACRFYDPTAFALVSGAGHDAMCVARVAPTGMLFVPSIGGRSHVGDERTDAADLELGVRALADAMLAADRAYSVANRA
jgi:hydantoinase/carbamoylase family amidase